MRRVLKFLEWRVQWWQEHQAVRNVQGNSELAEGLVAFAWEQESLQTVLRENFEALWKMPLE